jgi:hypothetical protein
VPSEVDPAPVEAQIRLVRRPSCRSRTSARALLTRTAGDAFILVGCASADAQPLWRRGIASVADRIVPISVRRDLWSPASRPRTASPRGSSRTNLRTGLCACYTSNRPRPSPRAPETTMPRRPRCPRKACSSPRETNHHLRSKRSCGSDGGAVYPGPRPAGRGLFSFPGFLRGLPPGRARGSPEAALEGELDARHSDRRPAVGRRRQGQDD